MEVKITRMKAGTVVIVTDETRDEDDALITPDGGVTMTITDPKGVEVVTDLAMTETSTGEWEKNWQSNASTSEKGMYAVVTKATHGSNVSIKEDRKAFELY